MDRGDSAPRGTVVLNELVADLRGKDEDAKVAAAEALGTYVQSVVREQSGAYLAAFLRDVNSHIYNMMFDNSNVEAKKGAIMAIGVLLDIDIADEDIQSNTIKYSHFLRNCLPNSDAEVMTMAASTIGKLVADSTMSVPVDLIIEFEANRALEWLATDRVERRRHAATLVLRELSGKVPTLFNKYVPRFFDLIWVAVRDKSADVRLTAVEALHNVMVLFAERSSRQRDAWHERVHNEISKGFDGNNDSILGTLLVVGEVLTHPSDVFNAHYVTLASRIVALLKHRQSSVRKGVVPVLPVLAEFNRDVFVASHLDTCMTYLMTTLKKEREKDTPLRRELYLKTGLMALAVGPVIEPYVDTILGHVIEGLTKRRNRTFCHEAITCVSYLAEALGEGVTEQLRHVIIPMFSWGLSIELVEGAEAIARLVPELSDTISHCLIDLVALILSNLPYRHPGTPPSQSTVSALSSVLSTPTFREAIEIDRSNPHTLALALETLSLVDFSKYFIHGFLTSCVYRYLDSDNPIVRKAAARSCASIAAHDKSLSKAAAADVVSRLLAVVVSDPDDNLRAELLQCLDPVLDCHLAQEDALKTLSVALNDHSFDLRRLALATIGRLAPRNPAYALPILRTTLRKLLSKLEFSGDSRNKEESALLLDTLILTAENIVTPYVHTIAKRVIARLGEPDTSPNLSRLLLAAVGSLATVGGGEIAPYLDVLLPQLIDMLQDDSSPLALNASLDTLTILVRHTGHVIRPYLEFPNLLGRLLALVKGAQTRGVRRQVIRLMGVLGAVAPDVVKREIIQLDDASNRPRLSITAAGGDDVTAADIVPEGVGPSSEGYFPTIAVNTVMHVLETPTLSGLHKMAVATMMQILSSLGLTKTLPFLPKFIPAVLHLLNATGDSGGGGGGGSGGGGSGGADAAPYRETLFQHLGSLVLIIKQHVRNFLPEIFAAIHRFWDNTVLPQILVLVEEVALALSDEFKSYLAGVLPRILSVFTTDRTPQAVYSRKVLHTLETLGSSLDEYVDLVAEAVVDLFESKDSPPVLRHAAVCSLGVLCTRLDFSAYASRIVHALRPLLVNGDADTREAVFRSLTSFARSAGPTYVVFIPIIESAARRSGARDAEYESVVADLAAGVPVAAALPADLDKGDVLASNGMVRETDKIPVTPMALRKAWEASSLSTKDHWFEWIRRVSVELLKQSSSPALRACGNLAQHYPPLGRQLFNAAFVSCWTELSNEYQEELMAALEAAVSSPTIPAEVLQQLLTLAEFMDRDGRPLPIDVHKLAGLAENCRAFAKALRLREIEYVASPSDPAIVESIIFINNQLQDPAAAEGILTHARDNYDVRLRSSWFEILGRWEDALSEYVSLQQTDPLNLDLTLGRMRCLASIGDWDGVLSLARERWRPADDAEKGVLAPLSARAAWHLGQWDSMAPFIEEVEVDTRDGMFFRAIAAVHERDFDKAQGYIDVCRDVVDTELVALVGESYNRAYSLLVHVQQLAELEEVMSYLEAGERRRGDIQSMWTSRLHGVEESVSTWQALLSVRSIVLDADTNMDMRLSFARLARRSGQRELSHRTIVDVLGYDPSKSNELLPDKPWAAYQYLKHLRHFGGKADALRLLEPFVASVRDDHQLLAHCYLSLGKWMLEDADGLDESVLRSVSEAFSSAVEHDVNWYKAWHEWAMMNYDIVDYYEKREQRARLAAAEGTEPPSPTKEAVGSGTTPATPAGAVGASGESGEAAEAGSHKDDIARHVASAVHGFFRAIALSNGQNLQDTLRLLTLWFRYGLQREVEEALVRGLEMVAIGTWLQVIPQLIARIDTPIWNVQQLVHVLLSRVGSSHPQALVYSLAVAAKSTSTVRQNAAVAVLDSIRGHSNTLVDQSLLVSRELIRVAILLSELWYDAIEDASRYYFNDQNLDAMMAVFEPLHEMMEAGPETLSETAFMQQYGEYLAVARDSAKKFLVTRDVAHINHAWDYYLHVFKRIQKALPKETAIDLNHTSPQLAAATNLELAVPGTYEPSKAVTTIASFDPTMTVIMSSKRPRKFTVVGSNGREYRYLLKGHEDLRQDERVMQLFGLVNQTLRSETETATDHYAIKRFEAVPLSPNSGLLSWVPAHDTLHALIREYRKQRKIVLDHEHKVMLSVSPADFDTLTVIQKIEVFEYALDRTPGDDLANILWLKSPNAESWYEKRLTYTRSLAVMSMVGYILGLGDRHPSNLMIDRVTGKILHIDFGDCFEVAMHRDRYAEKIPFRLTRLLINAMEVSGIEGNYRTTAERVMRVLRENKESLMAVLEAFVYDPLVSWRLLNEQAGDSSVLHGAEPQLQLADSNGVGGVVVEPTSERAVHIVDRVSSKLTGKDFPGGVLDVEKQVARLIREATSHSNLSQCYIGWCPFW